MNIDTLIRDPDRVKACLQELPDSRLVAVKPVKIYIPARFAERGLAEVGIDNYIVGIYAITCEDKYYGVSLVNAMIRIEPSSTMKIKIQGEEFFEFSFDAGQTIMSTVNLVKKDSLVYKIYNEILSKGKIPWYLGYDELGHIFDTAPYHSGANIGREVEVTELIVSIIARNPNDKTKYYRTAIKEPGDIDKIKPAYISLKSVQYAATNTTTKLAGSYFSDGMVSALVSPATREERIEMILRA